MSFTYFLDPNDPQDRDYVRFHIDDKTDGSGPLPGDRNLSDHEIDMILEVEGTWQRAVAACFEALEAAWVPNPSWSADGMSISQSHIAKNYGPLAEKWRKRYGGRTGSWGYSRSVIRVDGYSQTIASNEVS